MESAATGKDDRVHTAIWRHSGGHDGRGSEDDSGAARSMPPARWLFEVKTCSERQLDGRISQNRVENRNPREILGLKGTGHNFWPREESSWRGQPGIEPGTTPNSGG